MKKLVFSIFVGSCLLIPVQMSARDHDDGYYARDRYGRYYDPGHRDYHEWNERERRAWHRYWEMRHRREVAWERANERQRHAYWVWRHEYPTYY